MRLLKLSISCFRGFGPGTTEIAFGPDLTLFYGPNGFGKTSLAEAIEWLFYGTTLRRKRGETFSKLEYVGSLANVHGDGTSEVSAHVLWQGREIKLSRQMDANEAQVTLVDGRPADFASIGLVPPEAAYPVVAQHALQMFVHQKPKERRDAICEALGLEDLIRFKAALESARSSFQKTPPAQVLHARAAIGKLHGELRRIPSLAQLADRWSRTVPAVEPEADTAALIAAANQLSGATHADALLALATLRETRQAVSAAVFNLPAIACAENHSELVVALSAAVAGLADGLEQLGNAIADLAAAVAAAYATDQLRFWDLGLRIAPTGDTCPMCEAETLGATRRAELHERIATGGAVLEAQRAVGANSAIVVARARDVSNAFAAVGSLALNSDGDRAALSILLPEHRGEVAAFLNAHDSLGVERQAFEALIAEITQSAKDATQDVGRAVAFPTLLAAVRGGRRHLLERASEVEGALHAYDGALQAVLPLLESKVAEDAMVAAIDAVGKALRDVDRLIVLGRYEALLRESQALVRDVEAEIQRKQSELLGTRGQEIKHLHDLLHPNADVGFDAMEPATDNMKLHARSFAKRMPAAATLSQCQLNCLGLAIWLMRATTPSSPFSFVVLDDPVQAMDDSHTEAFIASVIPHLLDERGKQVIVLSHAKALTERLRLLHFDRSISHYQFDQYTVSGPVLIEQDRLKRMLQEIKLYAKGNSSYREVAVDRLRVLIEALVRELYHRKTGRATPVTLDRATASDLLAVFTTTPDTTPNEHAGLRDTVAFCDPAHHAQVGYSTPQQSQIQPHVDRVETLLKKYHLLS